MLLQGRNLRGPLFIFNSVNICQVAIRVILFLVDITWYQYPQASFQNLPLSHKQFSLVIWLSELPKCKCLMVSLFGRILASAPVSMSSLARGSVAASLRSTTQGSTRLANYSLMYFLYFEFCISCILYIYTCLSNQVFPWCRGRSQPTPHPKIDSPVIQHCPAQVSGEVVLAFAAFAFAVFKYALIQNCPAQVSSGASSSIVELALAATNFIQVKKYKLL